MMNIERLLNDLGGKTSDGIMFKKVDKKRLKIQREVRYFESKNITETNNLIKVASVWVAEQIGLKKRDYRKTNEPGWKRRIKGDIKQLRQDVNMLRRDLKGELRSKKKKQKMKELYEKYKVNKKGLKTLIGELKQRMLAKSAKVKNMSKELNNLDRIGFLISTKRRSTKN